MSLSSRLKFHERDFARRHRRGESIPFVLGRQSPRKLHGFLLIQHVTRQKKKIGFLRWRLNDRGRQESGRGRMRLRETPCLDHPRPCGQPDSLVVPTSSLITSSVLHCDTMSLQNRTSVEPSDRREEDMSSNNAIKKTVGRQSKASQALTRCTPYSQPWRCMYYLTNRISNNFWKKREESPTMLAPASCFVVR